jgi:hypothetical protein
MPDAGCPLFYGRSVGRLFYSLSLPYGIIWSGKDGGRKTDRTGDDDDHIGRLPRYYNHGADRDHDELGNPTNQTQADLPTNQPTTGREEGRLESCLQGKAYFLADSIQPVWHHQLIDFN